MLTSRCFVVFCQFFGNGWVFRGGILNSWRKGRANWILLTFRFGESSLVCSLDRLLQHLGTSHSFHKAFSCHSASSDATDGCNSLHSLVSLRGEWHIATRGTDTKSSNSFWVDVFAQRKIGNTGPDILGSLGWVFEIPWLALAFALVGGVKCKADEPGRCQDFRINTRGLLSHSSHRMGDYDRRVLGIGGVPRREEHIANELDSSAEEINFLNGAHSGIEIVV